MPREAAGIGHSRATPLKQLALREVLPHLIGSSVAVYVKSIQGPRKWGGTGWPPYFADMTCGPGIVNGESGSPLIMAEFIHQELCRGIPVRFVCVDRNPKYTDSTKAAIRDRFPSLLPHTQFFQNQREAISSIPRSAVGLSYWDPSRYKDLDADLLSYHGRNHSHIDILLTRECLAGLRMDRAGLEPHLMQDYLRLTGKRRGYLMNYASWGWWSFGFADNWEDRPASKLANFYRVDSLEGRRLAQHLFADRTLENESDE